MLQPTISEKHFKVEEVADLWNMSTNTVRRIFLNEPGSIQYSRPRSKYKRGYTTILIPESVLNRVYRLMMVTI